MKMILGNDRLTSKVRYIQDPHLVIAHEPGRQFFEDAAPARHAHPVRLFTQALSRLDGASFSLSLDYEFTGNTSSRSPGRPQTQLVWRHPIDV